MSTQAQKNILPELAKLLDVPVRKVNLRDPNVFQREQGSSGGNAEALAFREAVRFECEGLKAEIRGNGLYLVLDIKADLNAGTWSVNAPDQISMTRRVQSPVPIEESWPIFATGAELPPKAREVVLSGAFQKLVVQLKLRDRESLHFYKNAALYYARPVDAAEFLGLTRSICRFVSEIGTAKTATRTVELPAPFADRSEYAQWAISDDGLRGEAIESASVETLKELVDRVGPRLPSINAHLSTHFGEKEAALGNLAETVAEAQIALQSGTVR